MELVRIRTNERREVLELKALIDFAFEGIITTNKQGIIPAKVAVVASSLMGTVSGSGTSNVATVGVVTIPMMKKAGYDAEFAAAVEAVSSTGGQIMPPVMGAADYGHMLVPVIALIITLVIGFTPCLAAGVAVVSALIVCELRSSTRLGIWGILEAFEDDAKGMLMVITAISRCLTDLSQSQNILDHNIVG